MRVHAARHRARRDMDVQVRLHAARHRTRGIYDGHCRPFRLQRCQGMAPPPSSAAAVRSPVGAGRSTALWACWRHLDPARPANRYQDRHAVSRFSSQASTQARPTVLAYRPQGGGLSPITFSPPLPPLAAGRPLHILLPTTRSVVMIHAGVRTLQITRFGLPAVAAGRWWAAGGR